VRIQPNHVGSNIFTTKTFFPNLVKFPVRFKPHFFEEVQKQMIQLLLLFILLTNHFPVHPPRLFDRFKFNLQASKIHFEESNKTEIWIFQENPIKALAQRFQQTFNMNIVQSCLELVTEFDIKLDNSNTNNQECQQILKKLKLTLKNCENKIQKDKHQFQQSEKMLVEIIAELQEKFKNEKERENKKSNQLKLYNSDDSVQTIRDLMILDISLVFFISSVFYVAYNKL
jgi:hypothetical protein